MYIFHFHVYTHKNLTLDVNCGLACSFSQLIGCFENVISGIGGLDIKDDERDDAIVV